MKMLRIGRESVMCFPPSFNNLTRLTYLLLVFSQDEKTHFWENRRALVPHPHSQPPNPTPPRSKCSPYFCVYSVFILINHFMCAFEVSQMALHHRSTSPNSVFCSHQVFCDCSILTHLVLDHEFEVCVVPLFVGVTLQLSTLWFHIQ